MNKILKFLLSIVTTFSITSCGLLNGLNEEENEEGGGFDFGDSGLGTTEDTTPASDNTPSSDNPSSSGESQGETTPTETKYRINFYNGGSQIGYLDLKGGTKVTVETYTPIPTYPNPSSGFDYTFVGWSETRQNNDLGSATTYTVSKSTNLHAVYSRKLKQYSVNFKYGTTDLGSKDFSHGSVVETNNKYGYDSQLTKTESGKTYTFIGWNETRQDNDVGEAKSYTVNKNLTLYAVFSSSTNTYQITFKNGNTTLKGPTAVNHGVMPSAPTNPTKNEEKNDSTGIKYTYTFAGWSTSSTASAGANNVYASNNIPVATKDDTYYAIFSKTTYYLVTFYNGNTALTSDYYVESGKKPTYSGTQPSKSGSGNVTYTFIGWNESSTATTGTITANLPVVTKKTNYYAIFSSTSTGGGSSDEPEEGKIETIYSDDIIELYKDGTTDNNYIAKSAEYRVDETEASNYNIEISLDESGDEEFFKLETSNNNLTANITVLDYGRFTYLNIIYKNKTTSEISKIKKVKLLSCSEFSIPNYNPAFPFSDYIGIVNISGIAGKSVEIEDRSNNKFSDSGNVKYDLVVPTKWGSPILYLRDGPNDNKKYYPRRCYFSNNLIRIRLTNIFPKEFVYFEPSVYNSILFEMNYTEGSYNGFFGNNGIFAEGEDRYYFPYTKVQWNNSNSQWDENSYSPFNLKTDYSDKIGTNEFNQITKKFTEVRKNHTGFTK